MPEISKEIIALLNFLLPGFLAAWVIYGLTNHEKPSQFERTIQALIFTVLIQAAVWLLERTLLWAGGFLVFGYWENRSTLVASYLLALTLGLLIAKLSQEDSLYSCLRACKLTGKSSHPNEWNDVFSKFPRFVVLHLEGERRLFGWPEVWPSKPHEGHFFLVYPAWQTDEGCKDITGVEGVLINSKEVKWVEFLEKHGVSNEQPGQASR
jgi:Family of unknown function (DUF6338)